MLTRSLLLALALPVSVTLAGCDLIANIAGAPDEVDVSTGSTGQLAVTAGGSTVTSSNVNVGRDLPNVFDVDDLDLPAGSVTFTPSAAARGSSQREICPIGLRFFVGTVQAATGQVTVDVQGSTATVTDASVTFAPGYSASDVCGAFPSGQCPTPAGTYTGNQVRDAVTQAIQSGQFALNIAAQNQGTCAGLLTISQLRFGLDY